MRCALLCHASLSLHSHPIRLVDHSLPSPLSPNQSLSYLLVLLDLIRCNHGHLTLPILTLHLYHFFPLHISSSLLSSPPLSKRSPRPTSSLFSFLSSPLLSFPQLIAYELALMKGINPDVPRNLAKAVTTD